MFDLFTHAAVLVGAVGFAFLGRWTYLHPQRFLDRFYGEGALLGAIAVGTTKFAGGLWLFVGICAIAIILVEPLGKRFVPAQLLIGVAPVLSGLITWQLLRR
jgi:hypothetical protein